MGTATSATIRIFIVVCLACTLTAVDARALDNGLALTPPMGWNSWNTFGCTAAFNEVNVKSQADALVRTGLRDLGYIYVNLDDCWQRPLRSSTDTGRDTAGNIQVDTTRFPSGMAALAEYVHARGLKIGIYTDVGPHTCKYRAGSMGYEVIDARQYATWGIDYVKVDWCYAETFDASAAYARMRDALLAAPRPIVFSICNWGDQYPWNWGGETGHLWRTTLDIWDSWSLNSTSPDRRSIVSILDQNLRHAAHAGPGAWNDPDMLVVGLNGSGVGGPGMTVEEYRSHFSLWSIMAAPLIMGNDLTAMNATTLAILSNPEVIAVNQDRRGINGGLSWSNGAGLQIISKPLNGIGVRAVALVNLTDAASAISVNWTTIGLDAGAAAVRDLWARVNRGTFTGGYSAVVPSHGVVLLRIAGAEPMPPSGTAYLSDQPATLALNGRGPMERDQSNGEKASGDGRPLSLNGTRYAKGLGVHAGSRVEYRLGGVCSTFAADIGIDDVVGSSGAVVFEVWGDTERLYRSPLMTGSSPTIALNVGVAGRSTLRLSVLEGNDPGSDSPSYDYADWANARVTCASAVSVERTVSQDTFIKLATPTSTKGAASAVWIGAPANNNDQANALLKFNMSGFTGRRVRGAQLRVYVNSPSSWPFTVYELTRPFSETYAQWQNYDTGLAWQVSGAAGALDRGTTPLAAGACAAAGWCTINVNTAGLAVLQRWIDAGTVNANLIALPASASTVAMSFQSKEGTNKPSLSLVLE